MQDNTGCYLCLCSLGGIIRPSRGGGTDANRSRVDLNRAGKYSVRRDAAKTSDHARPVITPRVAAIHQSSNNETLTFETAGTGRWRLSRLRELSGWGRGEGLVTMSQGEMEMSKFADPSGISISGHWYIDPPPPNKEEERNKLSRWLQMALNDLFVYELAE